MATTFAKSRDRKGTQVALAACSGETREVTVLFVDIRGFTSIARTMRDDPQRLMDFVNAVLGPLSVAVLETGGAIDKFTGDGLMAVWGGRGDDAGHAWRATTAAMAMLAMMDEIDDDLRDRFGIRPVRIGVGVNSGRCVLGALGCADRFDYSVLGDAVNVAARLQSLTKDFDTPLLIGAGTAKRLPPGELICIDHVPLRGCGGVEAIYAPVNLVSSAAALHALERIAA